MKDFMDALTDGWERVSFNDDGEIAFYSLRYMAVEVTLEPLLWGQWMLKVFVDNSLIGEPVPVYPGGSADNRLAMQRDVLRQGTNGGCGIPARDVDTDERLGVHLRSYDGGARLTISGEDPVTVDVTAEGLRYLAESIERMRGVAQPWTDEGDEGEDE